MPRRYDSGEVYRKSMDACIRFFVEKGYTSTTLADICDAADISKSSFFNVFGSKEGILLELTKFMFGNQFSTAFSLTDETASPALAYAVETAIQLGITEYNENIRDIYVEAYTLPDTSEFIHRSTAEKLYTIFHTYMPEHEEADFYFIELGTAGIMRNYMAHTSDPDFPIEKKLQVFLELSLSVFHVPLEEQRQIIRYVLQLDIHDIALRVMNQLFRALQIEYTVS